MRGVSDLVGSQDVWRLDDSLGVAFCSWDGIGTPISRISRLNTRPTCAPTNAWHPASRQTAHGSGSVWFANLYRTTPSFATPRWFIPALPHVPHARDATGVGASCISGAAVLIRPTKNPRPAPAASQRPAPTPRLKHHRRSSHITRHQRRFTRFTRPVCPLPVTPGWNRGPSASPQSFAPRRCQRRTLRVGPGH